MFSFFKRKHIIHKQQEYINKLNEIYNSDKMLDILFTSEGKLILLNVYTENINELLDLVYIRNNKKNIPTTSIINVNSYTKGVTKERFKIILFKLIESLDMYKDTDLPFIIKNDLDELISIIRLLKD